MTELQVICLSVSIFCGLCAAALIVSHAILRLVERLGGVNVTWKNPVIYLTTTDDRGTGS
jgi:hypothetical protein